MILYKAGQTTSSESVNRVQGGGQVVPNRVVAHPQPAVSEETTIDDPKQNVASEQVEDDNKIMINDYLYFDTECGMFLPTDTAQDILYRQKNIICSYSGCNEWCHDFFCQLLDLYSGTSKYNHSLGTVVHKLQLEETYKAGHQEEVIAWVKKNKDERRFDSAAAALAYIIKDIPAIQ